jgi:hypothetical protein
MVAVCSKVVTAQAAAAVRTLGRLSSSHWKGKNATDSGLCIWRVV